MNVLTLLYDPSSEEFVYEKIIPAFRALALEAVPYSKADERLILSDSCYMTYLSDEMLSDVVMQALGKNCSFSFLPHPDMKEARQGYGISSDLNEAVADIERAEKSIKADLLLCNGKPVFSKVVIGESLSLMSGSVARNTFLAAFEKLGKVFTVTHVPQAYTITTENHAPLQTAALGIIAVLHGRSNLLSRQLLKDSYLNDARMHSLILAPKSIMQLVRFYAKSVFDSGKSRLPSFIGHIKSKAITIDSPEPINYAHDNNLVSAKSISFEVLEDALQIIPGRNLDAEVPAGEPIEVYKVSNMPQGEAYLSEIVAKPLSLIYHASTEEFKDLFVMLRESARATNPFLSLMVLSTLLATLGLFSNSSPVIIGAMILAPLMAPIISMSMGVLRQEKSLVYTSAKTIGLGLLLSYCAAILLTLITPLQNLNGEIIARIRPNLLDLGIAILSGIAGAYAHARKEVAKTLAGVAIAVALVPPLAVSGIGIGWGDWEVFSGALLLFTTNLTGIILAGSITFMLLGFSPFHLARKGLIISMMVVMLVSLPLGFGFVKLVRENNVIHSLKDYSVDGVVIRDVSVIKSGEPMLLQVRLVSDKPVSESKLDQLKNAIASKVGKEVELEIILSIKR
ncbi:DUF389 domain-containing protein [Pontibacter oryzae]|uniref:DUF389 domain-containing protein n=1 Tax=Pontibacter oryzae TaxID=2304593 RepID=A0A399SCL9_9BACT|nr:DUF389 domain-containing protein [Pontibacter oryzae]RIJ41470.1 DUF389 domain-containing protein [Pontibacter oryzae]